MRINIESEISESTETEFFNTNHETSVTLKVKIRKIPKQVFVIAPGESIKIQFPDSECYSWEIIPNKP